MDKKADIFSRYGPGLVGAIGLITGIVAILQFFGLPNANEIILGAGLYTVTHEDVDRMHGPEGGTISVLTYSPESANRLFNQSQYKMKEIEATVAFNISGDNAMVSPIIDLPVEPGRIVIDASLDGYTSDQFAIDVSETKSYLLRMVLFPATTAGIEMRAHYNKLWRTSQRWRRIWSGVALVGFICVAGAVGYCVATRKAVPWAVVGAIVYVSFLSAIASWGVARGGIEAESNIAAPYMYLIISFGIVVPVTSVAMTWFFSVLFKNIKS